jgi:hypothetical protein
MQSRCFARDMHSSCPGRGGVQGARPSQLQIEKEKMKKKKVLCVHSVHES